MDWAIGQAPAGGYVIALSLNAVLQHCSSRYQQHPVALNTFFFKKTEAGPFVVEISDLKPSKRGFCVIKAIMRQPKNREAIVPQRLQDYDPSEYVTKTHSIITMANMDGEKGLTYETLEAAKPPSTETMQHSQMDFMHQYIDIYQDMSTYPIRDQASGKTICPGRPEVHHSVCFKDGRETDFKSIPFWADLFIHPMYSLDNELLGGPSWMPTLQLEVQFKSVPKHVKRVLASFKVPHIINGRFDLDGALFDQDKNLLATTRHQCLVVPWNVTRHQQLLQSRLPCYPLPNSRLFNYTSFDR
ncbi:thioesterase-like superfamily-domain-containing protein [Zychaea mexicana]|uniref:thioesterase-like superfamily-domain-containing protein n=1 Tax=Zychaea mexicana TaxID=64656 RepID=UPI0022FDB65B|nr:thioesterase-like superfamily-domain-containing protein [Zychaea mexicana]KAI9480236.1 thioesterase-like superfamily-domain-containing protein [Zychaea mexicana]